MRALVLLGGGCKGAYQVGAINYLLGEQGIEYDIFTGVSVGALNAAMLSMFKSGLERDASATLLRVWNSVSTPKIRQSWSPFGILHLLWKPSVYDSSPLIDLVQRSMDEAKIRFSGKKLAVPAVSLNTGECRIFHHDHPEIVKAVLASSSYPGMFCPIEIDGQLWTDGGLRNSSLLKEAIDLGADSIDVIMTSPETSAIKFTNKPNAIDIIVRSLDVLGDELMEADLKLTQLVNRLVDAQRLDKKKVNIRVLRPKFRLPGKSLEFDQKNIRHMIELGYTDAMSLCEE